MSLPEFELIDDCESDFLGGRPWLCPLIAAGLVSLPMSILAVISVAAWDALKTLWGWAFLVCFVWFVAWQVRRSWPVDWVYAIGRSVQERLRSKPKARPIGFISIAPPRIPGKWIAAALGVGFVIGGLAWSYSEGRSHERARWEVVEADRQMKAAQAQRDLDQVAQSLAQRTVQAEREVADQVLSAVEQLQPRTSTRRVVYIQTPPDLLTPIALDIPDAAAYPDPAPVLRDLLPGLLDDWGGLQPPA
jgi:hypothetical protein